MGPTTLLPSEGRRAVDFFALKNPTASAGFETTNLGNKGQHASPMIHTTPTKYIYIFDTFKFY